MTGERAQCPARCPNHRNEIPFKHMSALGKFSNQDIQKYQMRVEEFSDPEARHCCSCGSYVPPRYKDATGKLICICGAETCYRCREAVGACGCCTYCHTSRETCTCCTLCRRPPRICTCCTTCRKWAENCHCTTITTGGIQGAIVREVELNCPGAKKCPGCPQAWIRDDGCNHSTFSLGNSYGQQS